MGFFNINLHYTNIEVQAIEGGRYDRLIELANRYFKEGTLLFFLSLFTNLKFSLSSL